jgi:hypothetical protein
MKIEYRHAGNINPANYNPRSITREAMKGLKASISKFGLVEPLIINARTATLVSGHQRLAACKELGIESVPVIEVDLSLAEEMALNVTLNNQKISGSFTDGLQAILEEIKLELPEFESLNLEALELKMPEPPEPIAPKPKISMIVVKCAPEHREHVHAVVANAVKELPYAEIQ